MTCIVLQKYAAIQKMTGNEQARSGHFCLCGYGAVRPALLPAASAGILACGQRKRTGSNLKIAALSLATLDAITHH